MANVGWGSFWEPGNLYNSPDGQDWYDTPLVELGEPDDSVFQRFLTHQGLTGYTNKAQFAQGLKSKFQTGFDAAAATNPFLTFREYMQGFNPDFINQQWNELSPEQQGKDYGRFYGGATRIQRRG